MITTIKLCFNIDTLIKGCRMEQSLSNLRYDRYLYKGSSLKSADYLGALTCLLQTSTSQHPSRSCSHRRKTTSEANVLISEGV